MGGRAVIIYSGGMDSFTLLNDMLINCREVLALSFNYGQRHKKELDYAARVCDMKGVQHKVVDLSSITGLLSGSSLTSPEVAVPEGAYDQENMKATVVPNRNCIMLSVAMGYAVAQQAPFVACAVHAGDHAIYPDCRPEFIAAMNTVGILANWRSVRVDAPYLHYSKAGILARGSSCGLAPHDYVNAWTCYKGEELACGRCGSCVERLEAFDKIGWDDPLPYEDKNFWRTALRKGA